MAIHRTTFYGNPYIGMFARTNDKLTIVGQTALPKFVKAMEGLGTETIKLSLDNSDLAGLYTIMNNHGILVSSIMEDAEVNRLKVAIKQLDLDLNISVTKTKFVALGNNVLLNDNGAIVNPDVDADFIKEVKDVLGVEVEKSPLADFKTVGAMAAATNTGLITHPNIKEEEMDLFESVLKVNGGVGTANQGVPFISISLIANNKDVIFGELTTGFEIGRIQEALGLIQ